MDKKQKLVVIINESALLSLVKDAGTFALFAGLMYFNHTVLNGSTFIDFMFILIVITWLSARNGSQVYSGPKEGAIKWLKDKQ